MQTVTCSYCGLPFKVRERVASSSSSPSPRRYFCCTGCAMLARVPVDAKGQFPVNAHLVSALAAGFLFFNQALFWVFGALLAHQGRLALAARFFWISAGVAFAVWCAVGFVQWRERVARVSDFAVMLAVLGLHVWLVLAGAGAGAPPRAWAMALANAALAAWISRGLLRRPGRLMQE